MKDRLSHLREQARARAPDEMIEGRVYLGIDPGFSGALAAILSDRSVRLFDMPTLTVGRKQEIDEQALLTLLRESTVGRDCLVVVEKAQSMPKQGSSSSFRYGMAYGMVRLGLAALGVPYRLAAPATWKRRMLTDMAKEARSDKKAVLLEAKRLFPQAADQMTRVKDHNRAEALFLAEYGRLQWGPKDLGPEA
jgi:crossover junction endodeoxyribonuclease RuvC